jgi:hypothetical protein
VKLHGSMTVNGRAYSSGDEISPWTVYPFFLLHMGAFGGSGFLMAYSGAPVEFLLLHGGIAIAVYLVFYLAIFGRDEVEWMFINAGLGLFGIVSQIDWLLSFFGKGVGDFAWYVHVIPCLYWILYTFLVRHMLLDVFHAREDDTRRAQVNWGFVGGSLAFYALTHVLGF